MNALVTSIEPQKRRKKRFNLYIDAEFFCGLSEDTIVRRNLKVGQSFTKKELDKLLLDEQYSKAFDKALRFLGYRPRSEKEIKDKLTLKDFHPKIIDKVIKELKGKGLLNDEEFSRLWIKSRKSLRPSGKYILERELKQKGIDKEIIDKIMAKEINEDEELNLALQAARKKKKGYKRLPQLKFNQKMSQFLARRGFSWNIIKKVLEKL